MHRRDFAFLLKIRLGSLCDISRPFALSEEVQKRTLHRAASMSEKCQKQTEVFPIGGALITH